MTGSNSRKTRLQVSLLAIFALLCVDVTTGVTRRTLRRQKVLDDDFARKMAYFCAFFGHFAPLLAILPLALPSDLKIQFAPPPRLLLNDPPRFPTNLFQPNQLT